MTRLEPPYDLGPPVPGSPWEEAGLELLSEQFGAFSVMAATGFIRKIPRVPARDFGQHSDRARGAVDRIRTVINDLLERGRIAMMDDGKYDLVLDDDLVSDALGGTPVLESTLTVTTGAGINATVTNGNIDLSVDDSVLRLQTIAAGNLVALWPISVGDPSSNPSGGAYVWVDSTGEFKARTSSGIVTTLAAV